MAQAREVIEKHARDDHYGMGDITHLNHVPDSTGELDQCRLTLDMCPHLADDPKQNAEPGEDNSTPAMSDTETQFRQITVYVPVTIAISDEVAESFEPERAVASMLREVMSDALTEPESVAEHDPMAIVGVSNKTHFEPDDSVWERVLPNPDKEVFGTVSRKPVRAADLPSDPRSRVPQVLIDEFIKTACFVGKQVEDGKLSGLTKVRIVLELELPVREPAAV